MKRFCYKCDKHCDVYPRMGMQEFDNEENPTQKTQVTQVELICKGCGNAVWDEPLYVMAFEKARKKNGGEK